MNENNETGVEVRRLRRLLKQMYTLAEHASLTGALEGGAQEVVEQYNRILLRLGELNTISSTLFAPLPTDASFDRVGVVSKLLEGYLADEEADGAKAGDTKAGGSGHKIIIGNVAGDLSGLEELKDLGRMIRDNINIPELWRRHAEAAPEAPVPPTPPVPPTSPVPPAPPAYAYAYDTSPASPAPPTPPAPPAEPVERPVERPTSPASHEEATLPASPIPMPDFAARFR